MVEKLLQRLMAETQIRQPAPVVASESAGLENLLRSLLSGQLDPGGGASRIAVPREAVAMEMRSSSVSSVVAPQSVPSRISVVLVEEAEVRGAECLASAPVDKDLRLLADVACPASVTVCEDCVMSPGVVGTLSPSGSDYVCPVGPDGKLSLSDLAGILFPAVPAGIPFKVGSVGHVGLCGTLSPSDSDSVGPIGPYGTLSPSDSDSVGPVGPYGTLSPSDSDSVVPHGTMSPSDSDSVGHVGPDGTLSSSDLAGILFPAVPAGIPFPVGPVGPVGPFGTLSPSDADSVGPVLFMIL